MRKQISRLLPNGAKGKIELICIDGPLPVEEDNPMLEAQSLFFKGMDFYDFARIRSDGAEDQLEAARIREGLQLRFPEIEDYYKHMASDAEDRLSVAEPRRYVDVEAALDFLQEQLVAHGPIDGVLGFSQGANFASLLAAQAEMGEGVAFSFVVHLCPARPGWHKQRPDLFEKRLTMRSLHISGERDFLNPPLTLQHFYEAPTCMMHEDSHRPIPGTSSEEANRISRAVVDFILNQPLAEPPLSEEAVAALAPAASERGARELTVAIIVDRNTPLWRDVKAEMAVLCGTSIRSLKEKIAEEDPRGQIDPEDFDFKIPGGQMLDDAAVIIMDDAELEIYIP